MPDWITVLISGAVSLLIALVTLLIHGLIFAFKLGRYREKVDKLETCVPKMKDDISNLKSRVDQSEGTRKLFDQYLLNNLLNNFAQDNQGNFKPPEM